MDLTISNTHVILVANTISLKLLMNKDMLSLNEIAKKFNVSYQTLNYYTSLGLVNPSSRKGNKRLYIAKDVSERLKKINDLKNKGYPLRIIATLINNGGKITI